MRNDFLVSGPELLTTELVQICIPLQLLVELNSSGNPFDNMPDLVVLGLDGHAITLLVDPVVDHTAETLQIFEVTSWCTFYFYVLLLSDVF